MRHTSDLRHIVGVCLLAVGSVGACSGSDPEANSGLGGATTSSTGPFGGGGQATTTAVSPLGGNGGAGGTVGSSNATSLGSGGTSSAGGTDSTAPATGGTSTATTSATGGKSSTGGTSATGGTTATGGKSPTGGTSASGGKSPTGGTTATGGKSPTGGTTATGGMTATGGKSSTGGTTATGGTSATLCPGATQVITVGASGANYTTVQAAVNSISASNAKLIQISVKAGTYDEQVTINKPFVCLTGATAETTIITHALGTNIVTGGTVIVTGADFSAANITFKNSGANGSGQAVALMANGKRQQFTNCRFVSYQDTLYVNTGTQYFKNCYIQGDTDYIFGDATAVFEGCTMNNIAEGTAVTAPRTPQGTTYGFVFIGGSLTANPTTSTVRTNHVYLGRPWGVYAAAAFINVTMGAHIAVDGWTTMSGNALTNTRFVEYNSTGAGANPTNATRSTRQLTATQAANYTVAKVLSPWVPGYSQ